MQPENDIVTELLARFRVLPTADRKAVLLQLPLEQRLVVEQRLRDSKPEGDIEDDAGTGSARRYAHYSPKLARFLTAIEAGDLPAGTNGLRPTAATNAAILASVHEIEERLAQGAPAQPPPLMNMLRDLIFGKSQKA